MTPLMLLASLFLLLQSPASAAQSVLVTGAAGKTGSIIYKSLKAKGVNVKASVYSLSEAKASLGCTKCDPSEGIYVGDVTQPETLTAAMEGVGTVLCAVGAGEGMNATQQEDIEFTGVVNQVAALTKANPAAKPAELKFVLCSSMGTTNPKPAPYEGGPVLFWKLNAEAFLSTSGLTSVVVKPGGLMDGPANNMTLVWGHHDELFATVNPPVINRADVAAVMVTAALSAQAGDAPLRFDLVSKPGPPPKSLQALLKAARWPWQQK